ncbi:MAG: hypothetical protein JNM85_09155 [Chthonomonas sp.]|nr:hypothetical protein [Chthonomonas sp.]
MILISTTHQPATDLGFLLHKNPDRIFERETNFGRVLAAYPEASATRTTVALVANVDPVKLSRKKGNASGTAEQYVNDRPYTANSFSSVALVVAFRTAMSGQSKEHQALAELPIPLEITIPVVRSASGKEVMDLTREWGNGKPMTVIVDYGYGPHMPVPGTLRTPISWRGGSMRQ